MGATTRKQKTSRRKSTVSAPALRRPSKAAHRATKVPPSKASRIVAIRQVPGALQVSIVLARHDFGSEPVASRSSRAAAAREAELLNLPLKEALSRIADEFSRKYCKRLMALEDGNLVRVATRAHYSERGMRDVLRRVGLRVPAG